MCLQRLSTCQIPTRSNGQFTRFGMVLEDSLQCPYVAIVGMSWCRQSRRFEKYTYEQQPPKTRERIMNHSPAVVWRNEDMRPGSFIVTSS